MPVRLSKSQCGGPARPMCARTCAFCQEVCRDCSPAHGNRSLEHRFRTSEGSERAPEPSDRSPGRSGRTPTRRERAPECSDRSRKRSEGSPGRRGCSVMGWGGTPGRRVDAHGHPPGDQAPTSSPTVSLGPRLRGDDEVVVPVAEPARDLDIACGVRRNVGRCTLRFVPACRAAGLRIRLQRCLIRRSCCVL